MAKAAQKINENFLNLEGLNDHEKKILNLMNDESPWTISDLKEHFNSEAFALCAQHPNHPSGEGQLELRRNSIVRNSLRKLVKYNWLDWLEAGTYIISDVAQTRLNKAKEQSFAVAEKTAKAAEKGAGSPKKATAKKATNKRTKKAVKRSKKATRKAAKRSKKA